MRVIENNYLNCEIVMINGNYRVTHKKTNRVITVVDKQSAYEVVYLMGLEALVKEKIGETNG